jgi:hypothetical protein
MSLIDPYSTQFFQGWNDYTKEKRDFGVPVLNEEFKEIDPILNHLIYEPDNILLLDNYLEIVISVLNEQLIDENPELFKRAYMSILRSMTFNIEDKEEILVFCRSLILTKELNVREEVLKFLEDSGLSEKTGVILECLGIQPKVEITD